MSPESAIAFDYVFIFLMILFFLWLYIAYRLVSKDKPNHRKIFTLFLIPALAYPLFSILALFYNVDTIVNSDGKASTFLSIVQFILSLVSCGYGFFWLIRLRYGTRNPRDFYPKRAKQLGIFSLCIFLGVLLFTTALAIISGGLPERFFRNWFFISTIIVAIVAALLASLDTLIPGIAPESAEIIGTIYILLLIGGAYLFFEFLDTSPPPHIFSSSSRESAHIEQVEESDVEEREDNASVYITPSGTKFHRADCQYVTDSASEIYYETAIERGYTPCSRCW